jgi:hypothetical protein
MFAPQFKELKLGDMNVNLEEESDVLSRKKLGRLGSRVARALECAQDFLVDMDSRRWTGRGSGAAA